MLKKRKCKRFPYFKCPRCDILVLRDTYFDIPSFFSLNVERSQKITARIVLIRFLLVFIFSLQQKEAKQGKQRKHNLIIQSLLSHNASDYFKFIIAATCGLRCQNGAITHTCRETKTACVCNLFHKCLTSG